MTVTKLPAMAPGILQRLAPGVEASMLQELEFQDGLATDAPLSVRRAHGQAHAEWWTEGLPVVNVEEHEYIGENGERGTLRLYSHEGIKSGQVLLYIHGGGWVVGSIAQNEPVIREIVHRSGWSVAAITYRLAPEDPFPAGLNDCVAAAEWLKANAARLGLDPDRIAVGGASAGGNLALAAALRLDREFFTALILFYGVFGADFDSCSYLEFADAGVGLTRASMMEYFDLYDPEQRRSYDPLVTPIIGDFGGLPPSYLVQAELDVLASDTRCMYARMIEAGVQAEMLPVAGVPHGFINRGRLIPASLDTISKTSAFLKRIG